MGTLIHTLARLPSTERVKTMDDKSKEKLEEAIDLALFSAYGSCNTIDGVNHIREDEYYYGGFISNGDDPLNPRGIRELKADLKEMGIKITNVEWSRDEEYLCGERDIRVHFTAPCRLND